MLYLQSHFLRPACPFLNTGEKNTYGGTAGLLFMVRLSDLPVLWRWKTPGRLLIWGKARFGAGKVMPAIPLTGNEEALDYTLRIVRNGKKLEAGNYFAVLGFRVDYE